MKKIIEGKVRKTFAEVALLEQVYLLDGVNKVADVLKQNANSVQTFYRFQVGEGIEKKKTTSQPKLWRQRNNDYFIIKTPAWVFFFGVKLWKTINVSSSN